MMFRNFLLSDQGGRGAPPPKGVVGPRYFYCTIIILIDRLFMVKYTNQPINE
jgi:hypothetical protein